MNVGLGRPQDGALPPPSTNPNPNQVLRRKTALAARGIALLAENPGNPNPDPDH